MDDDSEIDWHRALIAKNRELIAELKAGNAAGDDVFPETQGEIDRLKAQTEQSELIVAAYEKEHRDEIEPEQAANAPAVPAQQEPTVQDLALTILKEFEAARKELIGAAVVLSDGKAGSVEKVMLDELHGLRVAVAGHEGNWPISTVRFSDEV
jgi:hypothetical protein